MSPLTIVRAVLVVVATGYLAWVQSVNPAPIALPGLLALPLWLVVVAVAVATFVATWVPAWWSRLASKRQIQRLERRIAELESHLPSYDSGRSTPVIPDRVEDGFAPGTS